MTWKEIGRRVDEMFSQNYGTMKRTAVHFYGNDGICLFKYFVRRDDPRRSREVLENITDISDHRGDAMMWIVLCLNFACFVVITVCYAIINILTRRSSGRPGSFQNPDIIRQNRAMQNRVTAIIATDFFCWVPLSIICALHNLQVIDATDWYVNLTMLLLPINSVINPLLYDNTLKEFLQHTFKGVIMVITKSRISVYIRTMWYEGERDRMVENVQMQVDPTSVTRLQEDIIELNQDIRTIH